MIPWPAYIAHKAFVAPAKPSAALWRFVLGFGIAVLAYILIGMLFVELVWQLTLQSDPPFVEAMFTGRTPAGMLVMLGTFGFMTLGVAAALRAMHNRGFRTLFGPLGAAWQQFRVVLVALVLLNAALFALPPWGMGAPLELNLAPGLWIALLPLSLLGVLVQTSAEEIVFRGYVQQQLAARFASPLIWMVLPSALFAWGHYLPEEAGGNALAVALWAGIFGVLMADITARAGTLGPALALHFMTNVSAMLLVSLRGDLSGLALFLAPFGLEDEAALRAWMPVDFAYMIVCWLTARLALRR